MMQSIIKDTNLIMDQLLQTPLFLQNLKILQNINKSRYTANTGIVNHLRNLTPTIIHKLVKEGKLSERLQFNLMDKWRSHRNEQLEHYLEQVRSCFVNKNDKCWLEQFLQTFDYCSITGFLPKWKIRGRDVMGKSFRMGQWVSRQTEAFRDYSGFPPMSEYRKTLFGKFIESVERHPSGPKHRPRVKRTTGSDIQLPIAKEIPTDNIRQEIVSREL